MESFLNFVDAHVCSDLSDQEKWKVLIVDDEDDIHKITKLVLKPLSFENRSLQFFDAYSSIEAFEILKKEPDIAIVLLDVVMETDDAGLILVEKIREELDNKTVRIILRTGQPGQAPEKSVISKYDINDYKEKTELTTTKLFTSIISSLRSYKDIITLEKQKRVIEEKSFLNQYILNTIPCKSLLIDNAGTAIFCNNTDNGNHDDDWLCVTKEGKCTEQCNWLKMDLPIHSNERKRWEYKTEKKTYEVCYFPKKNNIRLLYAFDISDRIKVEEEKNSFEKQLIQSQKMEAIGLLASGIVHDFNNYLTAISGFAQIIANGKSFDCCKGYAQRIVKSVKKANKITSRLLVFSRKGEDKMLPVKIGSLIDDCVELLRPKSKLVKINLVDDVDNTYVFGDSNLLQNTFLNLGINAVDAMPKGGRLDFHIYNYYDNGIEDYYLAIDICDTGTGISPDLIERIFEPFFTTKEEGRGTGLGLAGAYGCIKKHNGIITVKSEEGVGTIFRILLPKLKHSDRYSPQNFPCSLPEHENSSVIDICSCDSITKDVVSSLVENIGYETKIVESLEANSDVLVLDLDNVPISYEQFLNYGKINSNNGVTLVLSSDDNINNHNDLNNSVVALKKPFEYEQFLNSFARALDLSNPVLSNWR